MSQVVQSKSKLEEARRQERSQKREKSPWATSISIESGSTDTVQLSRKPAHQAGVESLLLKREAELITNSPQRAMQVDAGGSRQIREGKEEADNCRLSEMADAKQKGVKAVQKRRERHRARCEEVRSGETSFDVCPLRKGGGRRVSATEQENMKKKIAVSTWGLLCFSLCQEEEGVPMAASCLSPGCHFLHSFPSTAFEISSIWVENGLFQVHRNFKITLHNLA